VKEYGDNPEDCSDLLQDGMIFKLDLTARKEDEDPMWASASSGPGDWFFAEDGS
jgi:hypothetical protein